jgi:metal-sulfur cluster biosynthetic enzyme
MNDEPQPDNPQDSADPSSATAGDAAATADDVRLALRKVKDPELNLNIIDLGLVYDIGVEAGIATIDMSLTSPGCPAGPQIMTDVERATRAVEGIEDVKVNLVWSPMWTPDRIEPRVRAYMGL